MRNFKFDGSMPREVLESYLSHAVTHTGLGMDNFSPSQTFQDDVRMLLAEGAKFVGRASLIWEGTEEEKHFAVSRERADVIHQADPEIILQGCIFEYIEKCQVEALPIPAWVFEEFDLPAEERCFSYEAMLNPDGRYVNHWGRERSVQDITRLETRMFLYYRARRYIDAGFEAIHFGQVHLIGAADEGFVYWREILKRIRAYASAHARRHYVLCDAHTHGISVEGHMLFDYNAWPIRLREVIGRPMEATVQEGYHNSIFGDSRGGVSPSGWYAESMPFIVEFDNFGGSRFSGEPRLDSHYIWGYDEITWFSLLPMEKRHAFLRYITRFVNERYPHGWVQMPSRRLITEKVAHVWEEPELEWLDRVARDEFLTYQTDNQGRAHIFRNYYSANRPSDACPFGFGDEDVIRECFEEGEKQ